jgi:opacity protein-like surface antigen
MRDCESRRPVGTCRPDGAARHTSRRFHRDLQRKLHGIRPAVQDHNQEEFFMIKRIVVLIVLLVLGAVSGVAAQDHPITLSPVEITLIPGGGTVFVENTNASAPKFGSYQVGGAVAYNFNRVFALEGEFGSSIGIKQDLDFGFSRDVRTPDMLTYSGNVVVSVPNNSSVVPYVTGGVGGLSLLSREGLGVNDTETLFTTNVGGGVKWYAGRWGLRADYRFIAVPSRDNVSAFGFGPETRYGHRVYGGLVLNVGR